MADNSKIEWLAGPDGSKGASWGPIRAWLKSTMIDVPPQRWGYHCERVSPGCKNCYACTMNGRRLPAWGTGLDYTVPNRDKVEIFLDEKELLKPLSWKKPRRVFPCSMTDYCATFVPDWMRNRMLAVEALCPQHTFLHLTKRAEECAEYAIDDINQMATWMEEDDLVHRLNGGVTHGTAWPLSNVWLGFSAENQECFDARWKHMRKLAAAGWKVWVSIEPMLSGVDISAALPGLSWCVVGGESGHGARPMHPDWARNLRDQCVAAGVPYFFKQWGEWAPMAEHPMGKYRDHVFDAGMGKNGLRLGIGMYRVGKKAAGRLLDGREWSEYPK